MRLCLMHFLRAKLGISILFVPSVADLVDPYLWAARLVHFNVMLWRAGLDTYQTRQIVWSGLSWILIYDFEKIAPRHDNPEMTFLEPH